MVPILPLHQGCAHDPGAGVVAVVPVAQIFDEFAFRAVAPAAILIDDNIAARDEEARHVGAAFSRPGSSAVSSERLTTVLP